MVCNVKAVIECRVEAGFGPAGRSRLVCSGAFWRVSVMRSWHGSIEHCEVGLVPARRSWRCELCCGASGYGQAVTDWSGRAGSVLVTRGGRGGVGTGGACLGWEGRGGRGGALSVPFCPVKLRRSERV